MLSFSLPVMNDDTPPVLSIVIQTFGHKALSPVHHNCFESAVRGSARLCGRIAAGNTQHFVQDGIRQGFATPWEDLLAQMGLGDRDVVEKLKEMKIKGSPKDQPSYRMIQSIDAEALIKQAARLFPATRGRSYQETGTASAGASASDGAIASIQRDQAAVSGMGVWMRGWWAAISAIRKKIETEPKIRQWLRDLATVST